MPSLTSRTGYFLKVVIGIRWTTNLFGDFYWSNKCLLLCESDCDNINVKICMLMLSSSLRSPNYFSIRRRLICLGRLTGLFLAILAEFCIFFPSPSTKHFVLFCLKNGCAPRARNIVLPRGVLSILCVCVLAARHPLCTCRAHW